MVAVSAASLPPTAPRYLMGVGHQVPFPIYQLYLCLDFSLGRPGRVLCTWYWHVWLCLPQQDCKATYIIQLDPDFCVQMSKCWTYPCRFGSALVFDAPGELNLKKKSFKFDFSPLDPGAWTQKNRWMVKKACFLSFRLPLHHLHWGVHQVQFETSCLLILAKWHFSATDTQYILKGHFCTLWLPKSLQPATWSQCTILLIRYLGDN